MNKKALLRAEKNFFRQFPQGFEEPELAQIVSRHKLPQMIDKANQILSKQALSIPATALEAVLRLITQSSLISVFEKPCLRDQIRALAINTQVDFIASLKEFLHADQRLGFEGLLAVLSAIKMPRWTLMTICGSYYRPTQEVFIKPTTSKKIIAALELPLQYKPQPSWEFYANYRHIINDIKNLVDASLSTSNVAFTGFLMLSLEDETKQ